MLGFQRVNCKSHHPQDPFSKRKIVIGSRGEEWCEERLKELWLFPQALRDLWAPISIPLGVLREERLPSLCSLIGQSFDTLKVPAQAEAVPTQSKGLQSKDWRASWSPSGSWSPQGPTMPPGSWWGTAKRGTSLTWHGGCPCSRNEPLIFRLNYFPNHTLSTFHGLPLSVWISL